MRLHPVALLRSQPLLRHILQTNDDDPQSTQTDTSDGCDDSEEEPFHERLAWLIFWVIILGGPFGYIEYFRDSGYDISMRASIFYFRQIIGLFVGIFGIVVSIGAAVAPNDITGGADLTVFLLASPSLIIFLVKLLRSTIIMSQATELRRLYENLRKRTHSGYIEYLEEYRGAHILSKSQFTTAQEVVRKLAEGGRLTSILEAHAAVDARENWDTFEASLFLDLQGDLVKTVQRQKYRQIINLVQDSFEINGEGSRAELYKSPYSLAHFMVSYKPIGRLLSSEICSYEMLDFYTELLGFCGYGAVPHYDMRKVDELLRKQERVTQRKRQSPGRGRGGGGRGGAEGPEGPEDEAPLTVGPAATGLLNMEQLSQEDVQKLRRMVEQYSQFGYYMYASPVADRLHLLTVCWSQYQGNGWLDDTLTTYHAQAAALSELIYWVLDVGATKSFPLHPDQKYNLLYALMLLKTSKQNSGRHNRHNARMRQELQIYSHVHSLLVQTRVFLVAMMVTSGLILHLKRRDGSVDVPAKGSYWYNVFVQFKEQYKSMAEDQLKASEEAAQNWEGVAKVLDDDEHWKQVFGAIFSCIDVSPELQSDRLGVISPDTGYPIVDGKETRVTVTMDPDIDDDTVEG